MLNNQVIQIEQQGNYPWAGDVQLTIQTEQVLNFELGLRIPGWCPEFNLTVNSEESTAPAVNVSVRINRQWVNGDMVRLTLAMPIVVSTPEQAS